VDTSVEVESVNSAEELLKLFVDAEGDHLARTILEHLIHYHADPVIKDVVRRKMGVHLDYVRRLDRAVASREELAAPPKRVADLDAEDVHATAVLNLIDRLWSLKSSAEETDINDFRAYVGRVALNAFAMHMRERCPERHRLRRRLWYLARGSTAISGFATWQGRAPGDQVFGFEAWQGRPVSLAGNYHRWRHDPFECQNTLSGRDPRRVPLPELVALILNWVGGPMDFDDLITGLAELLGIREAELVYE
jgi:hypothetical protein